MWAYRDNDLIIDDIPSSVKKQVYERDNHRCQFTGITDNLSIHHILKKSDGGPNVADNLILVNRIVHNWLHNNHVPSELYKPEALYLLARVHLCRDFMLVKKPPSNFKSSYEYLRAMFDGVDANDPKPPNPKFLDMTWVACMEVNGPGFEYFKDGAWKRL